MKKTTINFLFKPFLILVGVPILTIGLTNCGNTSPTKSFAELVVSDNSATLKDKSFSESTYVGWRQFMTDSVVANKFSSTPSYSKETFDMPQINSNDKNLDIGKGYWRRPSNNRENTFRQILNGGANLVIAPGFNHKEAIEKVATEYKDKKGFILLDSSVDVTKGDYSNVASFTFRGEQSGFLTGIATAEFLNANKEIFTNKSKGDDGELKVGGFIGQAIPSTTDFLAGFQSGIIAYNMKVNNSSNSNKSTIKWVSLGNDISNYASGNFGAGGGIEISERLVYQEKVDAIIPIAGPQTSDAISVILNGNRPAIVIGVDSPQEFNTSLQKELDLNKHLNNVPFKNAKGGFLGNSNILQFSAIKKLDVATYQLLASIFNESNPNNELENNNDGIPTYGFGYNNFGTLTNDTVGISQPGLEWINLFDSNWITNIDNKLSFNPNGGIFNNESYKNLEDKGLLYLDDISIVKNVTDLKNSVKSKLFGENDNRLLSQLTENSLKPSLNKKENSKSLNGSIWSLEKGKYKDQKNILTEPKKYLIK